MRTLLLFLCSILAVGCTTLNVPQNDFRRHASLSASNYVVYRGPRLPLSPPPAGKRPFYLSHYGRHGSRYLSHRHTYDYPFESLQRADSAGILTPLGKDLLQRLRLIRDDAEGRHGDLSTLGAKQQQLIAQRMYQRFPEIFQGSAHIQAHSTLVRRSILSMCNALNQLAQENPHLDIDCDATRFDLYFMNFQDTILRSRIMQGKAKEAYQLFLKKHEHNGPLMARLFTDTVQARRLTDPEKLNFQLFKIAGNIQNTNLHTLITLYDIFTDNEIYHNWLKENAWWYIAYGGSPLNGGQQPYTQRHLLRRIIDEADSCIMLKRPGATLRFGHETMVLPLVCLLDINGYGMQVENLERLPRKGWIDYKVFTMGCNVQFVFYRSDPADTDVLFKVLLNEEEATLPIKTDNAPYYRWSDFREYCMKKLNAFKYQNETE